MRPQAPGIDEYDDCVPEAQGALRIQFARPRELELCCATADVDQQGRREEERERVQLVEQRVELCAQHRQWRAGDCGPREGHTEDIICLRCA